MRCGDEGLGPAERALHERAVAKAAELARVKAELIDLLERIDDARVHEACGASSLFAYCVERLRLGEVTTYGLVTVMRKGREFPELRAAVADGLPLSRAVRIGAVMTTDTQAAWIAKARTLSKARLEREVAEASPEVARRELVRPVRGHRFEVLVNVGEDVMTQVRRAQDLVSQSDQQPASLERTLTVVTEFYLENKDPVAHADRNLARANSAVRNAVYARDRGLCQMVKPSGEKCLSSRFTHTHHVIAVALGGRDEPDNMITLCGACHRMWHRRHGLGPPPD